ncbi:hypothetical protein R3O74_019875 [Bacteroides hominis]|uniref:hypothetical protein n=1 Tax=Bacteroides hominis TaxID=2763023 RepID=UPI002949AE9F|nr:hypothetical protein [Bacteroides hominis (ex Liu et al. 2022)]MDV6176031.1 hypothetical protein [Bacteroides hominis (ex Liu et al. 2022)]
MNKRHYEHTLPNIRGSLSNTYRYSGQTGSIDSLAAPKKKEGVFSDSLTIADFS